MVWLKHFHNPSFFSLETKFFLGSNFLQLCQIFIHCSAISSYIAHSYTMYICGKSLCFYHFPIGKTSVLFPAISKTQHQAVTHLINHISCRATKLYVSLNSFTSLWKDCILLAFWDNLQCKVWGWLPKRKKEKSCLLRHSEQISLSYNAYSTHFAAPILLACLPQQQAETATFFLLMDTTFSLHVQKKNLHGEM